MIRWPPVISDSDYMHKPIERGRRNKEIEGERREGKGECVCSPGCLLCSTSLMREAKRENGEREGIERDNVCVISDF